MWGHSGLVKANNKVFWALNTQRLVILTVVKECLKISHIESCASDSYEVTGRDQCKSPKVLPKKHLVGL